MFYENRTAAVTLEDQKEIENDGILFESLLRHHTKPSNHIETFETSKESRVSLLHPERADLTLFGSSVLPVFYAPCSCIRGIDRSLHVNPRCPRHGWVRGRG